jgi:D-alanyl-lipoteichoic acid acyltransferase DltB (MBOAT superfamily)
MNILSAEFLAFVAALTLLYYILPLRVRKWLPIVGSAAFWLIGGVFGMVYLLAETALVWGAAKMMAKHERVRQPLFVIVLLLVFAGLFLLKEQLFSGLAVPMGAGGVLRFATPLGLSYFTFQSTGYLIDVYRGKAVAEGNYFKVLLFCGFFPQLCQGPIGMWRDLEPQLDTPHRLEPQLFVEAVFLMTWGFFKKLVIADRIAPFVQAALVHTAELPGWLALLAVIGFTIELYADFSGGIDIVRGVAQLIGIRLAENFRQPFFARSVSDYWRRWHISLGGWFRVYVFYPLATSRLFGAISAWGQKRFGAKIGNSLPGAGSAFLVFMLIGLWHAFQWNALLYGVWFGLISLLAILMEPLFKTWKKKLHITRQTRWFKIWELIRTWIAVLIAQFFACTTSPALAFQLMGRIRAHFGTPSFATLSGLSYISLDLAECIVAGIALVLLLVVDLLNEHSKNFLSKVGASRLFIRWPLLMLLMLVVLVFGHYGVGYNASSFVYAGF